MFQEEQLWKSLFVSAHHVTSRVRAGVDISARKALKEQAKKKKPKLSNKERYAMRETAPAEFKKKKFRDE